MTEDETSTSAPDETPTSEKAVNQRQIPGNLPYTPSIGPLKRALEKLIESERPSSFTRDFMSTVLGVSGGASGPVIPILKKVGFLTDSGVPTSLYSDFQSSSGRADAALSALRRGFPEIFKRNQYANRLDREKLRDIIRNVTGLPNGDRIIGYMYNTFNAFQDYATHSTQETLTIDENNTQNADDKNADHTDNSALSIPRLGLSYQINIVLPETTNIDVFSAIFKSLRENLMK